MAGRHDALIVRRDTEIPAWTADEAGLLRIGTKRPLPRGQSRGEIHPCRNDAIWRHTVLNPLDQWAQHVELISRGSARAMTHIRDRVKPGELCGPSQAAVLSRQFVLVFDCPKHRWAGIAQPMIPDNFAVVADELPDVQRVRIGRDGRRLDKEIGVGVEIKTQNVEGGIGRREPRPTDLTGALTEISGRRRCRTDLPCRDSGRSHVPAIIRIAENRVVGMLPRRPAPRLSPLSWSWVLD